MTMIAKVQVIGIKKTNAHLEGAAALVQVLRPAQFYKVKCVYSRGS